VSVELGTDANGRHRLTAGALSVRCSDEATARRMAGYVLEGQRRR
jgi:hypothetical protein